MTEILLIFTGIAIGALLIYLFMRGRGPSQKVTVHSSTLLEKVEKVFKIVLVEGHFSEIYDYQHQGKFLYFFNTQKKALLIVNAKVMVGYDFKKVVMEIDERTKKVRITSFPEPEVLSVDPEVRYYDVFDGPLNKFSNEDFTRIQQEAKSMILEKARESELPGIAKKQVQSLLAEIAEIKNWQLSISN